MVSIRIPISFNGKTPHPTLVRNAKCAKSGLLDHVGVLTPTEPLESMTSKRLTGIHELSSFRTHTLFNWERPNAKPISKVYDQAIQRMRASVAQMSLPTKFELLELNCDQGDRPFALFVVKQVWEGLSESDREAMICHLAQSPNDPQFDQRTTYLPLTIPLSRDDYPLPLVDMEFKGATISTNGPILPHLGQGTVPVKEHPSARGELIPVPGSISPEGGQKVSEAIEEFLNVLDLTDRLDPNHGVITKFPMGVAIFKDLEFMDEALAVSFWGIPEGARIRIGNGPHFSADELQMQHDWERKCGSICGIALRCLHSLGILHPYLHRNNLSFLGDPYNPSFEKTEYVVVHDLGGCWNARRHEMTWKQLLKGMERDIQYIASKIKETQILLWNELKRFYEHSNIPEIPENFFDGNTEDSRTNIFLQIKSKPFSYDQMLLAIDRLIEHDQDKPVASLFSRPRNILHLIKLTVDILFLTGDIQAIPKEWTDPSSAGKLMEMQDREDMRALYFDRNPFYRNAPDTKKKIYERLFAWFSAGS